MEEASTSTHFANVEVLSTGRSGPSAQPADPRASQVLVVTLILSPADAEKLELAKHQGRSVSRSQPPRSRPGRSNEGRSPPMRSTRPTPTGLPKNRACAPISPYPSQPLRSQVWEHVATEELQKEEKPAVVVDVYRGDKHVQELFK